jgi:predicted nuclease with TOPRIM domain
MVNENQRSAEVPMSRAMEFERATWANQLAQVVEQNGRLQAANEAVIGRVRELEQELEKVREQREALARAVDRLEERLARQDADKVADGPDEGDPGSVG